MSSAIESQLNETFRDALVSFYLSEVVPNSQTFKNLGLSTRLKTANDLYEFLLLDVQVSQNVQTSYVASAISSLQQYINSILLGMEPGYSEQVLNANQLEAWRDQRSQYPIWAANQQLLYYPELYVDPMLRLKKSTYFKQLEVDINQNKIELDTVQQSVQAYLASFEEVANLSIINGYIDSNDFASGTYYFIGKSRAENQYYWRSVNMSERAYVSGMDGPQSDYPNPGAWSDWRKANIGITPNTLEHTIRPVYFNNRLFVSWVDYMAVDETSTEGGAISLSKGHQVKLVLYLSYKKYDDSWSVPLPYIDDVVAASDVDTDLGSIAVFDNSHSPEGLFLAIHAKKTGDAFAFWKMCSVDRNFNSKVPECNPNNLSDPVSIVRDIFSLHHVGRMQFQVDASLVIESVDYEDTPQGDDYNFMGLKSVVRAGDLASFPYSASTARVSPYLAVDDVAGPSYGADVTLHLYGNRAGTVLYHFVLSGLPEVSVSADPNTMYYVLDGRSTVEASDQYYFSITSPSSFMFASSDSTALYATTSKYSLSGLKLAVTAVDTLEANSSLLAIVDSDTCHGFATVNRLFCESRHSIKHPADMTVPLQDVVPSYLGYWVRSISAGSHLGFDIGMNPATALPVWAVKHRADGAFYLYHGLDFRAGNEVLGSALKLVKLKFKASPPQRDEYIAPKISSTPDTGMGIGQYIDFTGSTIANSDGENTPRKPIRMNTLFARELVQKANIALENLLSWNTQQLAEPELPGQTSTLMDFHGANGLYFWELFLHLPLMVAQRLNLERQYSQSEYWLGFIFEPSRKADDSGRPDYWNVRPLVEPSVRDYAMRMPVDPDGQAASDPVIYQKAAYGYFIKNLLDRGDAAYRQLTPDSLSEAKLWYVRVLDLLGPRPDRLLVNDWTPITLEALWQSSSSGLRNFESQLLAQDSRVQASREANNGTSQLSFREPALQVSTFTADPMLRELDNAHFRVPLSSELTRHWDTAESRLYNLRHNLTLDGKALNLPLFAAPLDPRAMLAAFAEGGASGGLSTLLGQETPHYRFAVMHAYASAAVETLIQFGATLLSLIERKEQSEFAELQQQQMWEFASYAIELQEQTQKLEAESRESLLASKTIADDRAMFYYRLADENVSFGEQSASALHAYERIITAVASASGAIGQGMKVAPNVFGLANGGHRLEGVAGAVSLVATFAGTVSGMTADILDRSESYRRRAEDWQHAHHQARLESEQIDAQLKAFDEQQRLTAIQLRQANVALAQARISYEFLGKRFTKSQLYQWLNSQMSSFYYQAYDGVLSLCRAAESSWQFERADFTTRFVKPAWNDSYRGLLAGESLKLDLLKMNSAYLARHERLLEIVKTVSVRQLPVSTEDAPSLNTAWEDTFERLNDEGVAEFEITEALLDDDYPGHYLRRIKRISVSLPVTVGPYQDIRAVLTQSYNAVRMTAAADGVLMENLRASQQIAVSTGVDDDGLFVFNFDDERYLPFEGTGAISRWTLAFPRPETQKDMLESITDIIVHIRYTARSGGSTTSREARKALPKASKRKKT